jgi:hypothetical protein
MIAVFMRVLFKPKPNYFKLKTFFNQPLDPEKKGAPENFLHLHILNLGGFRGMPIGTQFGRSHQRDSLLDMRAETRLQMG